MPRNTVQPNGWVALRLPSDNVRVLQVTPNTFVTLCRRRRSYGVLPTDMRD